MQIRILGPLEASVDDRPVAVGGAKQRAVLAMLGLEANRTVTADRLIEGLWGEEPPPSAAKMVQNYVWRLRGTLADDGGAEILTHGRGYELRIDPEGIDVRRFERLISEADRDADAHRPTDAARMALALFRGDPLADLADEPFAGPEIRRLQELRELAGELAIDADLAAGRHREVLPELDVRLSQSPLRERLHAQRILALYRCGRQADALEAYRAARRTLVEEVGIEPGPELRRLHDAVLRQDPSLDVQPAAPEIPIELDPGTSPPLNGRDRELREIRARWRRAAAGDGALLTLVGAYGMGKTRVACELAADAHREGAIVLYAAGTGPSEAALAALARTLESARPTLLVIDDADRLPAEARSAVHQLAGALPQLPALVVATGQEAAALAQLEPQDSITLEPLDADAVRLIAGLYAPTNNGDAIPVETLLATSRGVARRVHEAAGEWARREATRRVEAVAGRAAASRTEAREVEDELAGSVVDLQSVRERSAPSAPAGDADAAMLCPYKGLATFDIEDAEYFFGREQLVADLVARLVGASLLCIVGPSGSGKSSLLRAGLLHALAGGVLPGSDRWSRALIRPGAHPADALRRAGAARGDGRRVVTVDQFEELFTACADEQERAEFVAGLVRVAEDPEHAGIVVIAIRADFYGRCAAYPELSRLVGSNQVLVGPMAREELRRAVERPAQRVGLTVEPALIDALLADVEGRPGALPLLSTALLELWRDRDGRRLRLASYTRSGGVQGAVARLAEDAFVQLDSSQQAVARSVLLRLASDGDEAVAVRRRVALSELEADRNPEVAEVVARLTDRRLLTVSDGAIEVAHECLLREWPRLRSWLEDDVQGRRLHRHISEAARQWDADARDPGQLYRGARLTAALEWGAGHDVELNATERAFLDESRDAGERAQRRLRLVLGAVTLLLVGAVLAGGLALDQRANARAEARVAQAQRLGAQALSEPSLDRALLLAREGMALDDSLATRGNLLAALNRSPAAVRVMRGAGGRMLAVAVRPNGGGIVAGDNQGRLLAFDKSGVRRKETYDTGIPVQTLRFSPDGTRLAVASGNEAGGALDLLEAATLQRIAHRRIPGGIEPFRSIAFSPDSRVLASAYSPWNDEESRPDHGSLTRWDARTGRRLDRPVAITRDGDFLVAFAGSGDAVVTMHEADGAAVVRDAGTLRAIRRVPATGISWASAVSPDGRVAALARDDGSLRLVDLRTGVSRTPSGRHDASVQSAVFSADGRTLVTAGDDAKVIVWDVRSASPRATFEGHAGRVASVALSPDARTAYSASLDGTVIAWDVTGSRRLGRLFAASARNNVRTISETGVATEDSGTYNIAASPDGDTLAVTRSDGFVNLFDSRTLRLVDSIRATRGGRASGAAFAPDGRTLAVTTVDGRLGFWDARTRRPLGPARRISDGLLYSPRFSADGRWLALAGQDAKVRLWDARRRVPVRAVEFDQLPRDLALRPDGRVLAVPATWGPGEGSVDILAVPSLRRVARIPMQYGRWSAFSPDGRLLILGDHEGRAQLYDGETFKPRGRPLLGHAGFILTAAFSPDGRMVTTSSSDGTVRLWDTASSRPIGSPLPGIPNVQVGATFIGGGSHVAAVYDTGQGYSWDVRPSSWAQHACVVAGRPLTRAEWEEAMPERNYEPACQATGPAP